MKLSVLATSVLVAAACTVQFANAATYQIIEIEPSADYRQHYATGISDNGTVIGAMNDGFNFPIYIEAYLSTITYNGLSCGVSETEYTSGSFDAYSTSCIRAALAASYGGNATYQKVGGIKGFKSVGTQATFAPLLDIIDPDIAAYTQSNVEQLTGINADGIVVGQASAPYVPTMFQQTGDDAATDPVKYWVREYATRAVLDINGEIRTIEPELATYGGESIATDISDTGYISGQTSVEIFEAAQTTIDENCNGELLPVDLCVWSLSTSGSIYQTRPVVWQVDASGNLVSTKVYDIAFEPTEEQTANYSALTAAVNDQGIAVGYGQIPRTDGFIVTQPLIFSDEGTNTFIDVDEYLSGVAVDINDSNKVIGHVQSSFETDYKDQFFVYDMETQELETPTTFYASAESNANAINDAGMIVGEAEYEITTASVRRKTGFIYNSVTKEFFDIRNLVACDSEYQIVTLNDINNSNQIAATALKLVEARDSLGNVLTNDDGTVTEEQIAVTILLDPIDGEPENCSDGDSDSYERQGASTSFGFIALLTGLLFYRRRNT